MEKTIRICHGKTCCKNATGLMKKAQEKIRNERRENTILIEESHCMGQCKKGPNIQIQSMGGKVTKNFVSLRGIENEIDILSGKKKPPQKPGVAKKTLNNLLSGGF